MSNYSVKLRPHKTLTINGNVIDAEEIEVPNIDHVEIDGMFVRFRRDVTNKSGLWKDTVDVAVYNREYVISWEKIGNADE